MATIFRDTVFLCFFFFIICASALASDVVLLQLVDDKGKSLLAEKIDPDAGFAIRYIHSVAKSPVTDYFKIKNNEIFLDRTEYQDFGAGLPHSPEDNQTMKFEKDRIIISGYDRALPHFQVRVGRVAEHKLLINPGHSIKKKVISLKEISPPGTAITFHIKTVDKIGKK